jgi:hypothetical protein
MLPPTISGGRSRSWASRFAKELDVIIWAVILVGAFLAYKKFA